MPHLADLMTIVQCDYCVLPSAVLTVKVTSKQEDHDMTFDGYAPF